MKYIPYDGKVRIIFHPLHSSLVYLYKRQEVILQEETGIKPLRYEFSGINEGI